MIDYAVLEGGGIGTKERTAHLAELALSTESSNAGDGRRRRKERAGVKAPTTLNTLRTGWRDAPAPVDMWW